MPRGRHTPPAARAPSAPPAACGSSPSGAAPARVARLAPWLLATLTTCHTTCYLLHSTHYSVLAACCLLLTTYLHEQREQLFGVQVEARGGHVQQLGQSEEERAGGGGVRRAAQQRQQCVEHRPTIGAREARRVAHEQRQGLGGLLLAPARERVRERLVGA
eukprot:scaffold51500_cov64-Phaeocystis_antarctica.AAC.4